MSATYPWTIYVGAKDTTPALCEALTWAEICAAIAEMVERPAPNKAAMLAVGPYRLRDGTTRAAANVEAVTLLALDVDSDLPDVNALLDRIRAAGVAAIVHTSPSDAGPGKPTRKVRVYLRPDRPMAPAEARAVRVAVARELGVALDATTSNADRIYYAGVLEGTSPREVWPIEGDDVPVDAALADTPPIETTDADTSKGEKIRLDDLPGPLDTPEARAHREAIAKPLAPLFDGLGDPGDRWNLCGAVGGACAKHRLPPEECVAVLELLRADDVNDQQATEGVEWALGAYALADVSSATGVTMIAEIAAKRVSAPAGRHAGVTTVGDVVECELSRYAATFVSVAETPAPVNEVGDAANPYPLLGRRINLAEEPAELAYIFDGLPFAPGGKVNAIAGAPYAGKSPFAQLLLFAHTTGTAVCGVQPLRKGWGLYQDAETGFLAHRRWWRICQAHGVDPSVPGVDLHDVEAMFSEAYCVQLEAYCEAHGPNGLVVIDTYGAMLDAKIDNNSPEFAHWLRQMGKISRSHAVVIVVLIHHNKSAKGGGLEGIAGNYQGVGAMQGVITLERTGTENEDPIKVICSRAPEKTFSPFHIKWTDVRATPGKDLKNGTGLRADRVDVAEEVDGRQATAADKERARLRIARGILECLRHTPGQGVTSIKAGVSGDDKLVGRVLLELRDLGIVVETTPVNKVGAGGAAVPVRVYEAAALSPAVLEKKLKAGIVE